MTSLFVPEDFQVPDGLTTDAFRLSMLGVEHTEADYEAVMASRARLAASSPNGWPREGFSLAENRSDLERHEREFRARQAFAYTVQAPHTDTVLGCVYIRPPAEGPEAEPGTAEVYLWVRDEYHPSLTRQLHAAVADWLRTDWPFEQVRWIRTEYYLEPDAAKELPPGR